jgi:hypothetical protein
MYATLRGEVKILDFGLAKFSAQEAITSGSSSLAVGADEFLS